MARMYVAGVPGQSIQQPSNVDAVVEGHEEGLEPVALDNHVVELAHALDVTILVVLGLFGPAGAGGDGVGVVVAVVGNDAPAEDIVGDYEAALAQEPAGAGALRLFEDGAQVVWVPGLLGVDEDEIIGFSGAQGGQPFFFL